MWKMATEIKAETYLRIKFLFEFHFKLTVNLSG